MSLHIFELSEYIFDKIQRTTEDISEHELKWMIHPEANNIHWILTHMTRIALRLIPKIIKGTQNPVGWEEDYQEYSHSLNELNADLVIARKLVTEEIKVLDTSKLDELIPVWGTYRQRKLVLYMLLSELIHHTGQIAMIRGTYKRSKD